MLFKLILPCLCLVVFLNRAVQSGLPIIQLIIGNWTEVIDSREKPFMEFPHELFITFDNGTYTFIGEGETDLEAKEHWVRNVSDIKMPYVATPPTKDSLDIFGKVHEKVLFVCIEGLNNYVYLEQQWKILNINFEEMLQCFSLVDMGSKNHTNYFVRSKFEKPMKCRASTTCTERNY